MRMLKQQLDISVLVSIVMLTWLPWSVLSQPHNQAHHGQQQHPPAQPHHGQQQHPPAQPHHGQQQHPPGQAGHGHGHHGKPLEFASEIHNADHILEHLQKVVTTKTKEQMTEEELEFHYFKLHDYDNNNKLDGVEIGKALTHIHEGDGDDAREGVHQARAYSDDEIAEVIDAALSSDDLDGDGYVEYPEFMAAQARRYDLDMSEDGMPPADTQPLRAPGYLQDGAARPPGF